MDSVIPFLQPRARINTNKPALPLEKSKRGVGLSHVCRCVVRGDGMGGDHVILHSNEPSITAIQTTHKWEAAEMEAAQG